LYYPKDAEWRQVKLAAHLASKLGSAKCGKASELEHVAEELDQQGTHALALFRVSRKGGLGEAKLVDSGVDRSAVAGRWCSA